MFKLALKYLSFHKRLSILFIICFTLLFFLPLFIFKTADLIEHKMINRAKNTPLIVCAKSNEVSQILSFLYFFHGKRDPIKYELYQEINNNFKGLVIPMNFEHTAQSTPVVGTTLNYFSLRNLSFKEGDAFAYLGDAVIGYNVAKTNHLSLNSFMMGDTHNLYDISKGLPLKLNIVGILNKTGTPDDDVVFVDIKTSWLMSGIYHGHGDVLPKNNWLTKNKLLTYNQISPDNIHQFHYHGDPKDFPVDGFIIKGSSIKEESLLRSFLAEHNSLMSIRPIIIAHKLNKLLSNSKNMFSLLYSTVIICVLLLFLIIIAFLNRIRNKEFITLMNLGCNKLDLIKLLLYPFILYLFSGLLMALGLVLGIEIILKKMFFLF